MHEILVAAALCFAQTAEADDRKAIDQRLVHKVEFQAKLTLEDGDTIFIERTEKVSSKRITKKPSDYETIVNAANPPKGVVVHARADEVRFEPAGDKTAITWRYAIHAEPGSSSGGGRVQVTLKLLERTGFANTVAETKPLTHWITLVPAKASAADLATDFKGYRLYDRLAKEKLELLQKKAGLKIGMADQGKVPSLEKIGHETASTVFEFERLRRRVWIAKRHLVAAKANQYLANLDKPDSELSGLPGIEAKAQPPPEKESKPAGGGAKASGSSGSGIAPVSSYEPGSESEEDEAEPAQPKKPDEKKEAPKQVVKPGEKGAPGQEGGTKVAQAGDEAKEERIRKTGNVLGGTELLGERELSKEIPIPVYPRALLLDDPNIAYAIGARMQYASVKGIRGTNGKAPAFFYDGEVGITRNVGMELSVPTAFVSVDVQRAQSTYVMGNPILSAKYRLNLPEVQGRQPVLTFRGRWAIPLQPLHAVPPTQLGVEEFTQPAHFVDLSAFLLEKNGFGGGANAAWMSGFIYVGAQMYADYYVPVSGANDQDSFLALSYGASVGAMPLGDLFGVFLEGRATSLLAGPRRTEFFTYLGARGRFADLVEPALWIALPLGSVHDVTGFQFGTSLRFAYDIEDAIVLSKSAGGDRSQLQDRPLLK